jgi:probable rRNA maturation factor
MVVSVTNTQREAPVRITHVTRLAQCAIRQLRIRTRGTLAITFIGARRMRALNRQYKRHNWTTDVLSFRYDNEPVVGDILIAPRAARTYATKHRIRYTEELSRYVVHGLLHWLGHNDGTAAEIRAMRAKEDRLLDRCGIR